MRSVVYNPPEEICDYFQLRPKKHNSRLCLDVWRSCEKQITFPSLYFIFRRK